MKKPEKKHRLINSAFISDDYIKGYNQACDDWEAFLPTEEELADIICKNIWFCGSSPINVAKAIHKRIMGEK